MSSEVSGHALRPRRCALVVLFFVASSFVLHHDAIPAGWWGDDPYILECAIFENPVDFFWRPEVYQRLSTWNFTPMVVPSYGLDYLLFGLAPGWFHAHQIVALGLVAAGICLLVSRWGILPAAASGLLFLSSGPATVAALTLMTRHYVEGACLALLSVLLLLRADRPGWRPRLAGLAYFAAALCKEVYVPLCGVAPFLPQLGLRRGLRLSLPLGVAFAAYLPLRLFVLGSSPSPWQVPWNDLLDPGWWLRGGRAIASMLFSQSSSSGFPTWIELVMILLGLVLLALCRHALLAVTVIAACSLCSLIPTWPSLFAAAGQEVYQSTHRLLIHVAVVWAVGCGYLLAALARTTALRGRLRPLPALLIGATALATALWSRGGLSLAYRDSRRAATREIEFLLTGAADRVLVSEKTQHYRSELAHIRRELFGEDTPLSCHMPFDLRDAEATYVRYSEEEGRFVDVTREFTTMRAAFRSQWVEEDLTVDLRVSGGRLHVEVDKDRPKTAYWLLWGSAPDIYERINMPPVVTIGAFISPRSSYVRVLKITRSSGWVLSPEWSINLGRDDAIHWER